MVRVPELTSIWRCQNQLNLFKKLPISMGLLYSNVAEFESPQVSCHWRCLDGAMTFSRMTLSKMTPKCRLAELHFVEWHSEMWLLSERHSTEWNSFLPERQSVEWHLCNCHFYEYSLTTLSRANHSLTFSRIAITRKTLKRMTLGKTEGHLEGLH
jgi:hypothetical protein